MVSFLVFVQNALRPFVLFVDDTLSLLVNQFSRLLTIRLRESVLRLRRVIERKIRQTFTHAEIGYHRVGTLGDALQVVDGTRRGSMTVQFLCGTSAQRSTHLIQDMFTVRDDTLLRQIPGSAQRFSSRHDGNFHQRIRILQEPGNCSMTRLVESNSLLLRVSHYLRTFLQATHDAVHRIHEILSVHGILILAGSPKGSLVADVGDVGTAESRRLFRKEIDIQFIACLDRAQVNLEYLLPFLQVWQFDMDLAVEAPGTQECLVQNIGTVRGSQDDDAAVRTETVHLRQELVQRILPFVIGTHIRILATGTSHGIYLVNKDDTRCFFLRLTEQVTHAAGTHTDEHLDKVATRHGEERHTGLSCHCLGEQRLACSRRAYQQSTLRYLTSQVSIFLRITEKLHNLLYLLFGSCQSCHVLERHIHTIVLIEHLCLRLSD